MPIIANYFLYLMKFFYILTNSIKSFFTFSITELKGLYLLSFIISFTLGLRMAMPKILYKKPNYNEYTLLNLSRELDSCIDTTYNTNNKRVSNPTYLKDSFPEKIDKGIMYSSNERGQIQQVEKLELNLADSAQLTKIKGIGPYFASKIIKLRNRYHGFYSIWQLKEIYFMDSTKINGIIPYLKVNEKLIKKHDLNNLQKDSIKGNFYFNFKMIDVLNNYRKLHGPYQSVDDILQTGIIPDSTFQKIKHYLEIRQKN